MLVDIHNHTIHFSPDARMTIDELISSSVKRGLSYVGITEHYEIDNPDPMDEVQTFDLGEYKKSFDIWRTNCPENLNLLMGIEFGYQTKTATAIDKTALSLPFDVILLSNHLWENRDVYYCNGDCYKVPKNIRHAAYIGKMAEMCETCDNFDIAAHYDYINRYNPDAEEYVLYEDCPDVFDRFFEALISKEKCLEINTKSILRLKQKGASHIMPDEALISRYIDMGGKLICLGSDSHTPDNLGILFEETLEYLKSLGVRELCYYKSRKANLYGI